jgi:hypothetical protein
MVNMMYDKFREEHIVKSETIYVSIEKLLTFMEEQGMLPPTRTVEKPLTPNMPVYDRRGKITYKVQMNEWEPEDEKK